MTDDERPPTGTISSAPFSFKAVMYLVGGFLSAAERTLEASDQQRLFQELKTFLEAEHGPEPSFSVREEDDLARLRELIAMAQFLDGTLGYRRQDAKH